MTGVVEECLSLCCRHHDRRRSLLEEANRPGHAWGSGLTLCGRQEVEVLKPSRGTEPR